MATEAQEIMEEVDMLVEDLHTRTAQVEEVFTKVRDKSEEFLSRAIHAATLIISDADRQKEEMMSEVAEWEEEKERVTSTMIFESTIPLSVGGHTFATKARTLTCYPETLLGKIFSGHHELPLTNGAYVIDRDGRHFHYILNFLRSFPDSPSLLIKAQSLLKDTVVGTTLTELMIEAEYYGLKDLMFPTLIDHTILLNRTNRFVQMTEAGDVHILVKDEDPWSTHISGTGIQFRVVDAGDGLVGLYCETHQRYLYLRADGIVSGGNHMDFSGPVPLFAQFRIKPLAGEGKFAAIHCPAANRFLRIKDGKVNGNGGYRGFDGIPKERNAERFLLHNSIVAL